MSRNRTKNNFYGNNFWQSADWNKRTFMMYREWMRSIALNRVKWIGLPETCDERYLEFTLLNQGVALVSHPKNSKDLYTTQVALQSAPNVYDNYTSFLSIGNNGWRYEATDKTGVVVWNSRDRIPILSEIDLFARRIAWFDRVIDSNLKGQLNPIMITAPQTQKNALANMAKQIAGGEPYIVGLDGMSDIKVEQTLTQPAFISENVEMVKEQIWSQFYTFMGIQNTPRKAERMIEEEVAGYSEPVSMRKLDCLEPRRQAAEEINKKFGTNIKVVWNCDLETSNYNYKHNQERQDELNQNKPEPKNTGLTEDEEKFRKEEKYGK